MVEKAEYASRVETNEYNFNITVYSECKVKEEVKVVIVDGKYYYQMDE